MKHLTLGFSQLLNKDSSLFPSLYLNRGYFTALSWRLFFHTCFWTSMFGSTFFTEYVFIPFVHFPGPPPFPLNHRKCGSLGHAPCITISCLTAIWRPSSRYPVVVVYDWVALVEQEGKAARAFALILFLTLAFCSSLFQLPLIMI